MFDEIAITYDKLNHRLSLGLDKRWRRIFVKNLQNRNFKVIADIASGTGDLLVNLKSLNAEKYYAIDPSSKMLELAKPKLSNTEFIISGAESIPLPDKSVDLITVSFGIRNFADLDKSFEEFYRILKPGGVVSIMEFSLPRFLIFRWGFIIYIKTVIPITGKVLAGNKAAYKYLVGSIVDFAKKTDVKLLLSNCGFQDFEISNLMLGSVRIYSCTKSNNLNQ